MIDKNNFIPLFYNWAKNYMYVANHIERNLILVARYTQTTFR